MHSDQQVDRAKELQVLMGELNDASKAFNPAPTLEGSKSRTEIISIAKQVALAMTEPPEITTQHITNMFELVAIRTLLSLKILKNIPDEGSISLQVLAEATGVQDSLLERLLRIVVATRFLDQTPDYEYRHTSFSRAYGESGGIGTFFEIVYEHSFLVVDHFHEYLIARDSFTEVVDVRFNPYTWTHKQDGTPIYEIMAQNPERLKVFQMGMTHLSTLEDTVGFYDFDQLNTRKGETRTILVDVGGGAGFAIRAIMTAHPELAAKPEKFVLQDLAEPIAHARTAGTLPEGVIKMEHNFFQEQPVKGAKVYYLRNIMHNYSDAVCSDILKQLTKAMDSDSVILISEKIVSQRCGEADLRAVGMDVCMLNMGGKERTEDGFREICKLAGLEVVRIWRPTFGVAGLVEARLTESISK